MTTEVSPGSIPLVDYLVLTPEPHLQVRECTSCGARFFDRREACASCFADGFRTVDLPGAGTVVSFTIVAHARPGVVAPYVAAIVECGGTWVRANLRGVDPDPAAVWLDMPVQLTTYSLGTDSQGTEAIGFGYRPADTRMGHEA